MMMIKNEHSNYATRFLIYINKYDNRKYLNKPESFSRKGKLTLYDTIKYPLLQEGHTNSREANEFIKLITGDDFAMISQQAIGEKRGYIDPKVYEDMYKDYIDGYVDEFKDELIYKEHMFLAGDTTVIKVPNVSKSKEDFPVEPGKPARARLSSFAHVFSGQIFTAEIVEKKSSEPQLAVKHLKDLKKRKIDKNVAVTYDRGYGSYDLIFNHLDSNIDFLMRIKDDFLEKEISQLKSNDEIMRIYLNKKKTNRILDDELRNKYEKERYIDLRVTRFEITNKNGEKYIETILSTLSMETYTLEDIKKLYGYRWEIETDYDRLKNILELENFTGQRRIIIEQDINAKIFLLNLLLTIKIDADLNIQKQRKDKNLKHEYQANMNHLLGVMYMFLNKLMESETLEERKKITSHMMNLANQRLVLKEDKRKKDPTRHTGDTKAQFKSNNRKA